MPETARASQIQNFLGGACPQTPLALHVRSTCTNQKLLNNISRIAHAYSIIMMCPLLNPSFR